MELGRLEEAGRLLAECQRVFEEYADTARLAQVLNERAGLEYMLGHMPAAADLRRAALRLLYARPEPQFVAVGHCNLADYLGQLGEDAAGQRAHRLAAAPAPADDEPEEADDEPGFAGHRNVVCRCS
jgi:hypothetical protein